MDKFEALKLDNQLCFPLYAASREVIKLYHPHLAVLGLTYTQYIAMMALWETGGMSVKELGARLYLDSGTLTPLLKELEKKGYVTRKRSEEDERVTVAEVTEAGYELREAALAVPAKVGGCIKLAPDEAAQLYGLLYKLLGK